MIKIYKASAGSGKTFQLVAEYLLLMMKNPYNYKHVLAVTFTNKATNEMKSRILEQLYLLAGNKSSDYLSDFQKKLSLPEAVIRKKARQVLKNILHDYNRFSISTIDSFTQRVIKAFNRELGISPQFNLELDNTLLLEEAVDRLLAKIDEDKKLLGWLIGFSNERIRENRSQRIEDDIKSLGQEFFKEKFQLFFPENGASVYTRENLEAFRKKMGEIIGTFESFLKIKGTEALSIIESNGLSTGDFWYKLTGVAGYFQSLSDGKIKEPGRRVKEAAENTDKWCSKNSEKLQQIKQLAESRLQPHLQKILSFIEKNGEQYYTALAVRKQLRILGILTDLKEELKLLAHEKGVLQLSDSNLLLSKIIGESESPFIYEKMGNYFHYFMLDEFQDTSTLQWKNFKPLLENSLAEGHENLLVGDVKQSIYRWRNSDWNILAEQVDFEFPKSQIAHFSLQKNWRSDKNIIEFNNAVFGQLTDLFKNYLIAGVTEDSERFRHKFENIYSDFQQKPGKKKRETGGLATVRFLPEKDFDANSTQQLIENVKRLQDQGMKASEMAILVRKNKEGTAIIEAFLAAAKLPENKSYNLSVLSNESLFLHSSKAVLFVVNTLSYLIDGENKITKATLLYLWQTWLKIELNKDAVKEMPEEHSSVNEQNFREWQLNSSFEADFTAALAPKLEEVRAKIQLASLDEAVTQICSLFGLFTLETELPFLQTFIDKAGEVKSSLSNDLSNLLFWWNEKGHTTSVNVNEEVESIRLLTVHKAKGLEFKAVFVPFLNWGTAWSGSQMPTLWVTPGSEPFNYFPLLPVKAETALASTLFKEDFYTEKISYFIDTLNLIYVAFTRAKSILVVHCKNPEEPKKKKEDGPGKSVNNLLKNALENLSKTAIFENCWNDDKTVFQIGEFAGFASGEVLSKSIKITDYRFSDFGNRMRLRMNSEDFLDNHKEGNVKNRGKLIHEILSYVATENDILPACEKAFREGLINESELKEIEPEMVRSFTNKNVRDWFSGHYEVVNERSLIASDEILRPDRIMISGNEAIVVDYKTGGKKLAKYNKQVKKYAATLKESGYEKVTGFLWYIYFDEVEKVCEF
ncbi:MAG: UvrD-helicase domain-containing protein [Prolixibacteraceae bacterium]|nr:UvrD-helicase domain-containing protein [Prolixibacteraceae bacterium]